MCLFVTGGMVSQGLRREQGGWRGEGRVRVRMSMQSVFRIDKQLDIIVHPTRRTINRMNSERNRANETRTKQEPHGKRNERNTPLTNTSWCSNTIEVARSERRTMIMRPRGYRSLMSLVEIPHTRSRTMEDRTKTPKRNTKPISFTEPNKRREDAP